MDKGYPEGCPGEVTPPPPPEWEGGPGAAHGTEDAAAPRRTVRGRPACGGLGRSPHHRALCPSPLTSEPGSAVREGKVVSAAVNQASVMRAPPRWGRRAVRAGKQTEYTCPAARLSGRLWRVALRKRCARFAMAPRSSAKPSPREKSTLAGRLRREVGGRSPPPDSSAWRGTKSAVQARSSVRMSAMPGRGVAPTSWAGRSYTGVTPADSKSDTCQMEVGGAVPLAAAALTAPVGTTPVRLLGAPEWPCCELPGAPACAMVP